MANLVKTSDAKLQGLQRGCAMPASYRRFEGERILQAINGFNGQRLAKCISFVDSYMERLRMWSKARHWGTGDGLLIRRRSLSHTFLQRKNVDVIYLDASDVVIGIELNIKPYKLCRHVKDAASILKVPAGTVSRTGTCVGHKIRYF